MVFGRAARRAASGGASGDDDSRTARGETRGRHRRRRRDRGGDLRAAAASITKLSSLDREQVDLGDADDVRRAAAEVGAVDVLVHAAAAFDQLRLATLDLDTWRRVQAVNVESGLLLAQAFAPGMAERGFGRIVFVTSDTVYGPPSPDLLAYVASKAALVGITRTLALSWARAASP